MSRIARYAVLPVAFAFAIAQGVLVVIRVRGVEKHTAGELGVIFRQTVRDAMGETWAKGED